MDIKKAAFLISLLLLLALFPLFFFLGPDYYAPRSYRLGWNLGHILFFFIFTYALLNTALCRQKKFYGQLITCCSLVFFIGLGIEFVQSGIDRNSDLVDLYRNCLGAALAVFLFSPAARLESSKLMIVGKTLLTLLLVGQLFYPLQALMDEFHAEENFPILADFESSAEVSRWSSDVKISVAEDVAFNGNQSLKAELDTSQYSGLSLNHFPGNWQAYTHLQLHIYREQALTVTVRINDHVHRLGKQRYSDRFNETYDLAAGWNTITIDLKDVKNSPDSRDMDLTAIAKLGVFVTKQSINQTIYLDYVRLIRK